MEVRNGREDGAPMELEMISSAVASKCDVHARNGFILITVLVITAIGLLLGAGSLLLFRYQCQMRIDRQHELEKLYAVRSAINCIKTEAEIPESGKSYRYLTGSGRDLGVLVRPVAQIFPDYSDERHLDINLNIKKAWKNDRHFKLIGDMQYNYSPDYEYGTNSEPVDNMPIEYIASGNIGNLRFTDSASTNTVEGPVKWWVNIGMRDTGGWLQEDYGRRYYFWPRGYVSGITNDIIRLCLIRETTNSSARVGCRHGWPLSRKGEKALVFQISPFGIDNSGDGNTSSRDNNNAEMSIYEYSCDGTFVTRTLLVDMKNRPSLCYMGIQLADSRVSVFYISNAGGTSSGCTLSDSVLMSKETYRYFANGIFTNEYGKIVAPDMRAVFEVEAASSSRNGFQKGESDVDSLTDFKVTPAYQYDVFLEHPYNVTNKATVAQKIGEFSRSGRSYTVVTYDTHGTDNKGFRTDERVFARSREDGR